jgi:phosphoribosylformylglycinamidine synthase subunit PurL
MNPYEVMLSESQERMLFVVERGSEQRLMETFNRWDLHCDVIGHVTDDGLVRVRDGEATVAELPADLLSNGARRYHGPAIVRPAHEENAAPPPFDVPADLTSVLLKLLANPNIASRRPVFDQYDHMVQVNTVVPPGEGSAVIRVQGTARGLTLGLGLNPRASALDPWTGGALAVAEACRNVACAGGEPIALTDCLNFGDPERAEVWKELVGSIEGIREACLVLEVPIISGNVSLYNESDDAGILPTPIIGALGLLEDVTRHARAALTSGHEVWLLGPTDGWLATSEYAHTVHRWTGAALPHFDLDLERRAQGCVRELIAQGIVTEATDIGDGGLAVTLAELAIGSDVGVRCEADWLAVGRADALCFGEGPSRIIVAVAPQNAALVAAAADRWGLPAHQLGTAVGREIVLGQHISLSLEQARGPWSRALDGLLKG